jgi:hypothetical protein
MDNTNALHDPWNYFFTVLAAVLAVLITIFYNNRSRKRAEKVNIFTSLFSEREEIGHGFQFVAAINAVPIVFYSNKKILLHYSNFLKFHFANDVDNARLELFDLLREMAADLNYKDIGQNSLLNRAFYPNTLIGRNRAQDMANWLYIRDHEKQYSEYWGFLNGSEAPGNSPPQADAPKDI